MTTETVDVEDISSAKAAGRAIREHGPYQVDIGDKDLSFQSRIIADPIVTGAQLLDLVGAVPPHEHQVFQILTSGALEGLRMEEACDLRQSGAERFIVFRSDRAFRLELNGRVLDWGTDHITGATLKKLARMDAEATEVWLDYAGGEDRVVGDDEAVTLQGTGVERFVTKLLRITIIVNARPKEVFKRQLTFLEVVQLAHAGAQEQGNTVYTVTYLGGPPQNPEGTLVEGQSVWVKNGMRFNVTATDKS